MTRLGLEGLHVGVGAVRRGRLVLGLLVLHGVDDLVVPVWKSTSVSGAR